LGRRSVPQRGSVGWLSDINSVSSEATRRYRVAVLTLSKHGTDS